jgi:hypothetical protein
VLFKNAQTSQFIQNKAHSLGMKDSFYDALIEGIKGKYQLGAPGDTRQAVPYLDWLKQVSPTFNWIWPHLTYVFERLEWLMSGRIQNLMIFMPPRHGKSEGVTVRFPVYILEQDPSQRVIIGSYNQTLASKFGRKCRRLAMDRITPGRRPDRLGRLGDGFRRRRALGWRRRRDHRHGRQLDPDR